MTPTLHITGDPEADALLEREPLALLIGMLLDQQMTLEAAFAGPKKLVDRVGGLDARRIADADPDEFAAICATPPAVHRYPKSMAKRIQALCRYVLDTYDGRADALWTDGDPDGPEVLRRLKALPGYGDQKARIFVALLGKQMGVQPERWREAAGVYGEEGSRRSVADVVDEQTLAEVRAFKRQSKAEAKPG
jgi:uncharacterized HhH-GPD family protein